ITRRDWSSDVCSSDLCQTSAYMCNADHCSKPVSVKLFPERLGYVASNGFVSETTTQGTVGDSLSGLYAYTFLSFNNLTITGGAHIESATLHVYQYGTQGDPYGT